MGEGTKGTIRSARAGELRRRHRELSILNAIASALNGSVELPEALRTTLAHVAELLDLRTGWIWLLDEESEQPFLAAAQNLPPALARNPQRMEGWCYCLETYSAGDLSGAANVNVVTCSRLKSLVDGTDGLRYHASIPLYAHGRRLGVMNLASPDWRELAPEDLRLLHTIGDLLSIAIERARLYARRAQMGAVEERNRLAREIHDTLAQGLAAVALRLEAADALLEAGAEAEQVRQAVGAALALTRTNLEEARRSVLDLRAAPLEGRTLAQALAVLAREWSVRGQLRITFTAVGGTWPLSSRLEVGVYRIAREALANIAQHAAASRARITLAMSPGEVRCDIADNGRGFDPDNLPEGHFGLLGMRERARLMGGHLAVQASPGRGTRVVVAVPLEMSA